MPEGPVSSPRRRSEPLIGLLRKGRAAALVAVLSLVGAAVALAASDGTYSGTNSETAAVSFKIKSHGAEITNFKTTLGYNGKCGQGGGPAYNADASKIAIGTGGKFSKMITLKFSPTVHAPGRIEGTASGTTVSGKVFQYLNGKRNKCYTETFTANKV